MCPKVTLLGRGKARVRTRAAGLRGGGGLSGPAASLQPHRGGLRCSACRYPSAASRGAREPRSGRDRPACPCPCPCPAAPPPPSRAPRSRCAFPPPEGSWRLKEQIRGGPPAPSKGFCGCPWVRAQRLLRAEPSPRARPGGGGTAAWPGRCRPRGCPSHRSPLGGGGSPHGPRRRGQRLAARPAPCVREQSRPAARQAGAAAPSSWGRAPRCLSAARWLYPERRRRGAELPPPGGAAGHCSCRDEGIPGGGGTFQEVPQLWCHSQNLGGALHVVQGLGESEPAARAPW